MSLILSRACEFHGRFGLERPILLAPMAGACAPSLSIAVMRAGGLGACGALLMSPAAIAGWAADVRAGSNGPFQMNLWIPDPAPARDLVKEREMRAFLGAWGPAVAETAGDATPPDFAAQCEAILEAAPPIVSSVMGLFPASFVERLKAKGIAWFANVSTVAEARAAEAAGADVGEVIEGPVVEAVLMVEPPMRREVVGLDVPEVPLADDGRAIAALLQELRREHLVHRHAAAFDVAIHISPEALRIA